MGPKSEKMSIFVTFEGTWLGTYRVGYWLGGYPGGWFLPGRVLDWVPGPDREVPDQLNS